MKIQDGRNPLMWISSGFFPVKEKELEPFCEPMQYMVLSYGAQISFFHSVYTSFLIKVLVVSFCFWHILHILVNKPCDRGKKKHGLIRTGDTLWIFFFMQMLFEWRWISGRLEVDILKKKWWEIDNFSKFSTLIGLCFSIAAAYSRILRSICKL